MTLQLAVKHRRTSVTILCCQTINCNSKTLSNILLDYSFVGLFKMGQATSHGVQPGIKCPICSGQL
jgi:hypothetical protein